MPYLGFTALPDSDLGGAVAIGCPIVLVPTAGGPVSSSTRTEHSPDSADRCPELFKPATGRFVEQGELVGTGCLEDLRVLLNLVPDSRSMSRSVLIGAGGQTTGSRSVMAHKPIERPRRDRDCLPGDER